MLLVLGTGLVLAAMAAAMLHDTRSLLAPYRTNHGLYGPLVVARAFAAFGAALLAGALMGRTLPASVVAAVASAALFVGLIAAREAWTDAQREVIIERSVSGAPGFDGLIRQPGWLTPDGILIDDQEAVARRPDRRDAPLLGPARVHGDRGNGSARDRRHIRRRRAPPAHVAPPAPLTA